MGYKKNVILFRHFCLLKNTLFSDSNLTVCIPVDLIVAQWRQCFVEEILSHTGKHFRVKMVDQTKKAAPVWGRLFLWCVRLISV